MLEIAYLEDNYNDLIQKYGGKIVLIRGNKVVFSDKSTKIVVEFATNHFKDKKYLITRIDEGDAALY